MEAESVLGSSSRSDEERMEEDEEFDINNNCVIFSLAEKIHKKLSFQESQPLPVKSHRSAVTAMLQLRNLLLKKQEVVKQEVRMLLLYSGISVQRRVTLGAEGEESEDLKISMALLLMLQVLCDDSSSHTTSTTSPPPFSAVDPPSPPMESVSSPCEEDSVQETVVLRKATASKRAAQQTLELWYETPLRCVIQEVEADGDNAWASVLRTTTNTVCRACVAEAPSIGATGSIEALSTLANTFFRCSSLTLQYSLLESMQPIDASPRSFLTLSVADVMMAANDDLKDQKLKAIVDSGESEAGQQVLAL